MAKQLKEAPPREEMIYETLFPNATSQREENLKKIQTLFETVDADICHGRDLFVSFAEPESKTRVDGIVLRFPPRKMGTRQPLNWDDSLTLHAIAEAQLTAQNYTDAGCMFRGLIYMNPLFLAAWVGSAVAEIGLDHLEEADKIFEMALTLFENNGLLVSYAAPFYISIQNKKRAKEILTEALRSLNTKEDAALRGELENYLTQV